MREVAFATCAEHPALVEDDLLAIEPLRTRGIAVTPVVWDAPFDHPAERPVVIRSCWDYHRKKDAFLGWVRSLARKGVSLWNPASVVEWNHDKGYLRDLEAKGVPIPPTEWVKQGAELDLASLLADRGWPKAVVKPLVSASAWRTFVTEPRTAAADEPAWRELLRDSGGMVQPFLPEVQTSGEWSLLFFGGEYSHAVLKRPRPGDFRVQSELGGTVDLAPAPGPLLAAARRLLALVEEPLLFARVDALEVHGEFLLMELELIEPGLFLGKDPGAPQRFAEAIATWSGDVDKGARR
jgi:hypothetical protein